MLIHLSSEKYNRIEYLAAGSVVSASTTQSNPGFREQLKVAWCISFYSRAGFLLCVSAPPFTAPHMSLGGAIKKQMKVVE